jgi:hypothetical protein
VRRREFLRRILLFSVVAALGLAALSEAGEPPKATLYGLEPKIVGIPVKIEIIEFKIMGMQLRLIEIPIRVTETPIRLVEIPNIKELIREKGYINGIPITTVYKGGKCWRFIRKDGKILMVNEDKTLRSPTEEELRELREIFPGEKFEGGEPPEEVGRNRGG